MFVMACELLGALKAARLFACEDETRTHMNSVHLEAAGTSALRLVATDGHTLWCCEIPARDSAADPAPAYQASWNMRLADVDAIVKGFKDHGEVELLLSQRSINGQPYEQRDEHFPVYANVIPAIVKAKQGKLLPEFAASYTARACEALTHYSRGFAPALLAKGSKQEKQASRDQRAQFADPPIAWCVGAELDPAIFYSPKFPCAFAIIMPRRGENLTISIVESFVNRVRMQKKSTVAA